MTSFVVGSWKVHHFAILILASLSTAGTNYMHDMLNVLQPVITRPIGCRNDTDSESECCFDCLGLGDREYNLIHTELFWTCAISLIISGYMLDKFGNWILIVLVSFSLFGGSTIAIGASMNGTDAVKPMLFTGTFLRGLGLLTSLVARGRILSNWFLGKEIGCAFGAAAAINRIGSVPSYMLTEVIREAWGLPVALWVGVGVCAFSVLCAVAAVLIDTTSRSTMAQEIDAERRRSMSLKDVKRFSSELWILIILIGFYSSVFRSTQANATEMIHETFGFKKSHAAIVAGEMLYMSVILSPIIGLLLDKTGRRGYATLFASSLHVPALGMLAFTDFSPVIGCFLMGIAFCCFTSVFMSSVSLLVDRSCVGMATALAQLSSTICTGAVHIVLSEILDTKNYASHVEKLRRWQMSTAFVLAVAIIATGLAAILLCISVQTNSVLIRKPCTRLLKVEDEERGN